MRDIQKPRYNSLPRFPPHTHKIHGTVVWNYWGDCVRRYPFGFKPSTKAYNIKDCPTELNSRRLRSSSTIYMMDF